jgi:hypothetical protein
MFMYFFEKLKLYFQYFGILILLLVVSVIFFFWLPADDSLNEFQLSMITSILAVSISSFFALSLYRIERHKRLEKIFRMLYEVHISIFHDLLTSLENYLKGMDLKFDEVSIRSFFKHVQNMDMLLIAADNDLSSLILNHDFLDRINNELHFNTMRDLARDFSYFHRFLRMESNNAQINLLNGSMNLECYKMAMEQRCKILCRITELRRELERNKQVLASFLEENGVKRIYNK